MHIVVVTLLATLLASMDLYAQHSDIVKDTVPEHTHGKEKEFYYRDYSVVYALYNDILNSSVNCRTASKMLGDAFHRLLSAHISNDLLRGTVDFAWTFVVKWFSMLWPHELGHMLRTQQVGGIFTLERFVFPGIVSSLTLPQNASTEHHTLALIGGFEANYLTARDIQCDFHRRNGLYNDDIGLAFGHRIMYPLYAFVFAPQDPNSPQTWRAAGGDPINFTKLVWELGNRPVFNPDSSINQDLVHFYNQTVLVSILWNMLDGNFYKEILAFFGNQVQGQQPISWRTDSFQWSYGTVFNTSPLGAELYLHNYFTVHQAFYSIYLKYGFPLKNYGIGITATDVLHFDRGGLDVQADAWNQDLYGMGFCLSSFAHYTIFGTVDLHLQAGYKTQGYVLGRPIQNGLIGYVGMRYRF